MLATHHFSDPPTHTLPAETTMALHVIWCRTMGMQLKRRGPLPRGYLPDRASFFLLSLKKKTNSALYGNQKPSASKMASPTATFTQLSKNAFLVSVHYTRLPFPPPSLNACSGHQLVPLLPLCDRISHESLHPHQCLPSPSCGRLAHASYASLACWHRGDGPTFWHHYVAHTRMGTVLHVCKIYTNILMALLFPIICSSSVEKSYSLLIQPPIVKRSSPLVGDFRYRCRGGVEGLRERNRTFFGRLLRD